MFLSQVATQSDLMGPYVTAIGSLGGFGLMLLFLLTGRLYTKSAYEERTAERDEYRKLAELERLRADEAEKYRDGAQARDELIVHILQEIQASSSSPRKKQL